MILEEVYNKIKEPYSIKLLAGKEGLKRSIDWVHSIEDQGVIEFLHGDELVLTTGIASKGDGWLLSFVQELVERKACGVLVNQGPYMKKISKEVLSFCEQENFAIFLVPWEVRLVDITKEISSMIFAQQKERIQLVNGMKDAIFYPEEESSYCNPLKRQGYLIQKKFCPILMEIKGRRLDEDGKSHTLELLRYMITFRFSKSVFFSLSKYYVVILYQSNKENIDACVDMIRTYEKEDKQLKISNIVVGPNLEDIKNLHQSYQIACRMSKLARRKDQDFMDFERIGSYQILLNIRNETMIKDYFQKILYPLKAEDEELFQLFRIYLETDCSVQETSKRYYCHRNTINKKVHRIREILQIEEMNLQTKAQFIMAYEIYDIME